MASYLDSFEFINSNKVGEITSINNLNPFQLYEYLLLNNLITKNTLLKLLNDLVDGQCLLSLSEADCIDLNLTAAEYTDIKCVQQKSDKQYKTHSASIKQKHQIVLASFNKSHHLTLPSPPRCPEVFATLTIIGFKVIIISCSLKFADT